jgi:hypothetical protein
VAPLHAHCLAIFPFPSLLFLLYDSPFATILLPNVFVALFTFLTHLSGTIQTVLIGSQSILLLKENEEEKKRSRSG